MTHFRITLRLDGALMGQTVSAEDASAAIDAVRIGEWARATVVFVSEV